MRLLDLYCGAGGAGMGYIQSGFDVVGIDIVNQPDYPGDFIQADAIEFVKQHGHEFDVIHASPPCQSSSSLTKGTNKHLTYVDLIPATREALSLHNVPTIIENVQQAEVRKDLTLCGEMFGLGVIRHRWFELNFDIEKPEHIPHRGRVRGWRHGEYFDGPYLAVYGRGGYKGTVAEWQVAMDMPWTKSRLGLAEAIPPAYTKYIGLQLNKD